MAKKIYSVFVGYSKDTKRFIKRIKTTEAIAKKYKKGLKLAYNYVELYEN